MRVVAVTSGRSIMELITTQGSFLWGRMLMMVMIMLVLMKIVKGGS